MKSALVGFALLLAASPAAFAQVTAGNSGVAPPGLNRGNTPPGLHRGRALPAPLAGVGLSLLVLGGGYVAFVNQRRRRRSADEEPRAHRTDAV